MNAWRSAILVLVVGALVAAAGCDARTSSTAVSDKSAAELIAAFATTLYAGPTHFMMMTTGAPYSQTTSVGVEDLAHSSAEYVQDIGPAPGVWLVADGYTYECTPHGPTTVVFAPGYCDASAPWVLLDPKHPPLNVISLLKLTLTGRLPLTGWTSSSGGTVHSLGKAVIRGVAVSGYSFDFDTATTDVVFPSGPVPGHNANGAVHMWLDSAGLVREFRFDIQSIVPGLGSPPSTANDGLPADIPVLADPSLDAQRSEMNSERPAADRTPAVASPYAAGQLTASTTVQLWDIGTAPAVQAPPPEALHSPSYPH